MNHEDIPLCRYARQVTDDAEDDVSLTKDNVTAAVTVAWTTNITVTHLYTSVTVQTTTSSTTSSLGNVGWFQVVIPLVCFLGIIGNIFNIIVLTRRRMVSSLDRLGRSAYHGLVALALSDLLFCVTVLPLVIIPLVESDSQEWLHFAMVYRSLGVSLINLFLMSSTWLVVLTAVTRYMAVIRPLETRLGPCSKNTIPLIACIFIFSFLVSLPHFIHMDVNPCWHPDVGQTWQYEYIFHIDTSRNIEFYMRWVWPVIADFIPICVLIFCNVMLVRQLRAAAAQRRHSCPGQNVRETSKRITTTLVCIILMQLLLVTPGELLKYSNPYSRGWIGRVIADITNVMQTMNFASNFLLYLAVNVNFRKTVKVILFEKWRCKRSKRSLYRRKAESHSVYGSGSYVSLRRLVTTEVKEQDVNS